MEEKEGHGFVKWFSELSNKDVSIAGGKGASLAEMYINNFPIPPGFVVTAQAYKYYIEKTGLEEQIKNILNELDVNDNNVLNNASKKIRELFSRTKMPKNIEDAILDAYEILDVDGKNIEKAKGGALGILKTGHEKPFVAVRSSATTEDLESISEDEHVLLKINQNTYYEKIKDIYKKFGDCTNYNVEVPAMKDNKIEWIRIKCLLKHSTTKSELYKIKTITGREITISPSHTLILLDEDNLEPIVADITKVKKGSKIPVIGLIPEINNDDPIIVSEYVKGNEVIEKNDKIMIKNNSTNWSIQNGMPKTIEVTEDFAYFLGLYVAEGSTYQHNCISVTNSNYILLERIEDFCRKIGVYEKNKINKHSVRIYSPALVKFLHETCGKPNKDKKGKGKICSEKRVPNFIFGWSKKNIGAFLKGCFDGDGTISKYISYCTTSEMLAGGMLKLLEILGLGFYFHRKGQVFKINIPLADTIKFRESIAFADEKKNQKLDNLIIDYQNKSSHPEFKYNLMINDTLSNKIKNFINKSLPIKEIEVSLCKNCENEAEQTSYYNEKKRYYCKICKKAYYENQIEKVIVEKQDYFDYEGRFRKRSKPWNYGKIKGKLSLNGLNKISNKYDIKDMFPIFEGTVKWEEISDVIPVENKGELYDFSVPKVENFAAGFGGIITHNSASFAGQQESFLNVKGEKDLLEKVRDCFSSLFTARAIYYREKKGFAHEKSYLAAVVQKMVDSEKSGVIFSKNPTIDDESIVIEAVWGLGEGIVSGQIKPDYYVIDSDIENFKILESKIADKKIAIVRNSSGDNKVVKLSDEKRNQQVLTSYEIKRYAQYARQLEEHYGKPQDIEFAIEGKELYIVQSRPITTKAKKASSEIKGKILFAGLGASPGVSSGTVRIVENMSDLPKVKKGDILVTKMTNPDMVVAMQRSTGIITDEGGVTSHAAIVSREMGIPAVVGTGEATSKLKDGEVVTVDGNNGKIYEGKAETQLAEVERIVPTKTKIKVIVDLPEYASRAARSGAKGVGLVRLEGIIASTGKHPMKYVKEKKIGDYITVLSNGLKKIVEPFEEVWIRSSDIRSDEFRHLEGSVKEVEGNPMLGDHGIRFSLKHPEILKAELMAIKEVADDFPHKKIGLMAPQIISVSEVKKIKEVASEIGIPKNVKIGIMVETPAAVQIINQLCEEGISFISFGTNDLTQFTLAVDRNNSDVQDLYDETHPAVLNSISYVIRRCKKYGVETSICGQAGSKEDVVRFLIKEGIDSISVNADAAKKVSELVASLENNAIDEKEDSEKENKKYTRENNKKNEVESKKEIETPNMKSSDGLYSDEDIEDIVLKELGNENKNEYQPGGNNKNKDVPSLNDAISIDSSDLYEIENKEEEVVLTEDSEKNEKEFDLNKELSKEGSELGEEWNEKRG